MVAQHTNTPDDPPRRLTPAVEQQLEAALREFVSGSSTGPERMREAIDATAAEGRERGLRPEELIVALRRLEEGLAPIPASLDATLAAARHKWLKALLEAYYRA